jgi:hypothetical protein
MNQPRQLVLILFAVSFFLAPPAHAQGQISGIAQLTIEDGRTLYADWLRVLLVRSEVEMPACPDLEPMGKFERIAALRNLHMRFFVNVRDKMADPDYVIRSTLTTPDGTFQFSAIPPGMYFILVTFPAMIQAYKVAWQIPVTVKDHETAHVELNQNNLLVPTYSRD